MSDQFGVVDEAVSLHVGDDFSDVLGIVVDHRRSEQIKGSGTIVLSLE